MNKGLGVMIKELGGNEISAESFRNAIGKTIKSLSLRDNKLYMGFEGGCLIALYDDGQSCCEDRYMRTDDDLAQFIGGKLFGASVRDGAGFGEKEDEYGNCHEVEFLVVDTDKGSFTMANHNEHNGYYGGFYVICESVLREVNNQ